MTKLETRLPFNAETEEEIYQYYSVRAMQLASCRYEWDGYLHKTEDGIYTTDFYLNNKKYISFYAPLSLRNNGLSKKLLKLNLHPLVTVKDCGVYDYLIKYSSMGVVCREGIFDSIEYNLIQNHYVNDKAKRSGIF